MLDELNLRWSGVLELLELSSNSMVKAGLVQDASFTYNDCCFVSYDCTMPQNIAWSDMIETESATLDTALSTMCQFCAEMDSLARVVVKNYIPKLVLYEKHCKNIKDYEEGKCIKIVSRMVRFFMEVSIFVRLSTRLVGNVLASIVHLYENKERVVALESDVSSLLRLLGFFVYVLCEFDTCVEQSTRLKCHAAKYQKFLLNDPSVATRFSLDNQRYQQYRRVFARMANKLLAAPLRHVIAKVRKSQSQLLMAPQSGACVSSVLLSNIDYLLGLHQSKTGTTIAHSAGNLMPVYSALGLFVLHSSLFGLKSAKLLKQFLNAGKNIFVLSHSGLVVLQMPRFLLIYVTGVEKVMTEQSLAGYSSSAEVQKINEKNSPISNQIVAVKREFDCWCSTITAGGASQLAAFEDASHEGACPGATSESLGKLHENKKTLMLKTLELIDAIRYLIITFTHYMLQVEPSSSQWKTLRHHGNNFIRSLLHMKRLLFVFSLKVSSTIMQARTVFSYKLRQQLKNAGRVGRFSLQATSKRGSADKVAANQLMAALLNKPLSWQRCLVLLFCMEAVFTTRQLKQKELLWSYETLRKYQDLSRFYQFVDDRFSLAFTYSNTQIFTGLMADIYHNPKLALALPQVTYLLDDYVSFITCAEHTDSHTKEQHVVRFKENVKNIIHKNIIAPISINIEALIRTLAVTSRPPGRTVADYSLVLMAEPFRLHDELLQLNLLLTAHLQKEFYNLTAISPSECRNYSKMRILCNSLLNVAPLDGHFPTQKAEQGVDVIEIIRNLDHFVDNFAYNLNDQVFIQRSAPNNFYKAVQVKHIASSIRTHGVGIANSAMNSLYQLLKAKFIAFSTFLNDEKIKSLLVREVAWFSQDKKTNDDFYPIDRAEMLSNSIQLLSQQQHQQQQQFPSLEKFRDLLCQIGNILGFVRMLRNSILNFLSPYFEYVSELRNPEPTADQLSSLHSNLTKSCASHLDSTLELLSNISESGIDYFQILIKVLSPHFQAKESTHLSNFYILIPSLILSAISKLTVSIEATHKKNKENAGFADDGIWISIPFILRLLHAQGDFNSLNVFKSLEKKTEADRADLERKMSIKDNNLTNVLHVSRNNLKNYQKLYQQVQSNLECAEIFFAHDQAHTDSCLLAELATDSKNEHTFDKGADTFSSQKNFPV